LLHARRWELPSCLERGDLVVANDAATLPASLQAIHEPTGATIEIRLAARDSLSPHDVRAFTAVLFGAGNFRTRTENRPLPPPVDAGDRLLIGATVATIEAVLGHPRFLRLQFEATAAEIWAMFARHGRPIQYAHVHDRLALWDVWTSIAAAPVAYEPPSASFILDWSMLDALRVRGIEFATLTHAAGISSTGDPQLDRRLPLPEPYEIPVATSEAIAAARALGRRVIAIGTTVVRALEHAAQADGSVRAGRAVADQRLGPATRLRVVDAILSGTHEPQTSHYELLGAFIGAARLEQVTRELETHEYLTHEFGDSVFIEADREHRPPQPAMRADLSTLGPRTTSPRNQRASECVAC
jgi:S-adenosylmethionine:tRNA ribosyltransferase-isomerase